MAWFRRSKPEPPAPPAPVKPAVATPPAAPVAAVPLVEVEIVTAEPVVATAAPPAVPVAKAPPAKAPPPAAAAPPPSPAAPPPAPEKKGLFARFKDALSKTTKVLNTDVRDLFKKEGRLIDDAFLDQMLEINIKTDMGYESAQEIVEEVKKNFRARVVHLEDIAETWKNRLKTLMAQDAAPIRFAATGPTVIMVCGVNGSGKTTSIAKLTALFKSQGKSVVLGAGDTFRAAAVEQLTIWAERLGAEIVRGEPGIHPASVAYKAVERAIAINADICIVDTAGRLQTQKNLMAELTKIESSIRKQIPDAPHEVILTIDATTGQNGISQAKNFTEAVKCTGIVLAKLDGTAKGGVVVAIRQQVGLPVKYVGLGEKPDDLAVFQPNEFVDALFADLLDGKG